MEARIVSHARWIVLFAAALFAAIVFSPAGRPLSGSVRQDFHLTYTTYPLASNGQVDRGQAPTRHWYRDHRSRMDTFSSGGADPRLAQSFIMDCDSSRMITIDWSERTYTLMTFEEFQRMQEQMMRMAARFAGQMPGMAAPEQPTGPGGTVTVTTVWRDSMLDERLFGLPVRWTSMAETREASADACYAGTSHSQVERWITDLDLPLCIPPFDVKAMAAAAPRAPEPTCTDRIVEKTTGSPRTGFVLREWSQDGSGGVTGWEVVELSRESLPDSLFVPPTGFRRIETQMPSDADMAAADAAMAGAPGVAAPAPPKAAGAIRVGVSVKLPAGTPALPGQVATDVAAWIREQGLDAVPLAAMTRDAALAEAPGVEADYVLWYDVDKAEIKASARGMLGGAIGGGIGGRAAGGAMQLQVEGAYELLKLDGEQVTDGEIEEKQPAEDPQSQLAGILQEPAGEAIRAIRR